MLVEFVQDKVEGLQSYEDEEGGCGSEDVHASSAGQTDGRCDPETGGCGESAYHILAFVEDDGESHFIKQMNNEVNEEGT